MLRSGWGLFARHPLPFLEAYLTLAPRRVFATPARARRYLFSANLSNEKLDVTPHVAQKARWSAIDGRTTRHPGYAVSGRKRKLDGNQVAGDLADISNASIVVFVDGGRRDLAESQVARIERLGDPLRNGALIGGAIMTGLAVSACRSEAPCGPLLFWNAAFGAGLGALVDWARVGREVVFIANRAASAPSAFSWAPLIAGSRRGLLLSVEF